MRRALRPARTLLQHNVLHSAPPVFLCPALLRAPVASGRIAPTPPAHAKPFSTSGRAREKATTDAPDTKSPQLPRSCPGCGAPTQLVEKDEAGFYNVDRSAVRNFLTWNEPATDSPSSEDHVYSIALRGANPALLKELGVDKDGIKPPQPTKAPATPVCDRCHALIHHRIGSPIHHPTVESIQQTIAESPHRRNHIYHVVDAADFPLSIVPNLQSSLRIPKLRTQNRRAKHKGWVANDRIAEVSFIITRADLLAPKKEQVDALMPYILEVLRDALGRENSKARLGNVRLVSAKRGWWTRQVKDDIWERGGAGWMVGKVNVGKSNLFEAVFPKGRGADYQDIRKIRSAAEREAMLNAAQSIEDLAAVQRQLANEDAEIERHNRKTPQHLHQPPRAPEHEPEEDEDDFEDPDALLPPAQPFTMYPVLPIASSLPGTTASPIRVPFGRNRGELVDLPGLARTNPGLETFVQPSEQDSLIMKSRMNAERFALKPGQSLILGGGLIRLTPLTSDLVFLVHPFVPIHPHVTRTDKAIGYQSQQSERQLQVPPILASDVGPKIRSAGTFPLKWDATKKLTGALTSPVAAKMKPENLPFRIWSTDILIEGVGWIEVSAQTRRPKGWKPLGMTKKDPNHAQKEKERRAAELKAFKDAKFGSGPVDALSGEVAAATSTSTPTGRPRDAFDDLAAQQGQDEGDLLPPWEPAYPEIEVFSPLGKFVGARRPMCASAVAGPRIVSSRERGARPRRSMVSVKRQRKSGGGGTE